MVWCEPPLETALGALSMRGFALAIGTYTVLSHKKLWKMLESIGCIVLK